MAKKGVLSLYSAGIPCIFYITHSIRLPFLGLSHKKPSAPLRGKLHSGADTYINSIYIILYQNEARTPSSTLWQIFTARSTAAR